MQLRDAIAAAIAERSGRSARCVTAGISGAQGTGKSSLAALVSDSLRGGFGLRAVTVSLDDYYLPKANRVELARTVQPLLVTRGVPGTHDVAALHEALRRLATAGAGASVELLQFSKAADDRQPQPRTVTGPFDVVLFEGWCVGASAQSPAELASPINALERDEDSDGRFRNFVNLQLGAAYAALWTQLDLLVFLAAPDFATVHAFREEQERELRASAGPDAPGLMSEAQLGRFIQHFERVTRHMLHTLPKRADVFVQLDEQRRVTALATTPRFRT